MPTDDASKLRSFAAADRFVAEVKAAAASAGQLRPGYVLAGDEIFLYERCRRAVVDLLIDPSLREF
jgi:DNA polymerase-3 subunit delta